MRNDFLEISTALNTKIASGSEVGNLVSDKVYRNKSLLYDVLDEDYHSLLDYLTF